MSAKAADYHQRLTDFMVDEVSLRSSRKDEYRAQAGPGDFTVPPVVEELKKKAKTTFVRAAGLFERSVAAEHNSANEYYTKEKVRVDWQFMLVFGIFFGALISSFGQKL